MRNTIALCLPLIGLALGGCGGATTEDTTTAADYEGPVASTDTVLGAEVFDRYCNGCHPGGDAGRGPAIRDAQESPGAVRHQIREGGANMPGFGADRIDATQLEALLAHLQTIGTVASSGTTETDVVPPTEGGEAPIGGDEEPMID